MQLRRIKNHTATIFAISIILAGTVLSFSLEKLIEFAAQVIYQHMPDRLISPYTEATVIIIALIASAALFYLLALLGFKHSGKLLNSTAKMIPSDHQNSVHYFIMGYSPQSKAMRLWVQNEIETQGAKHVAQVKSAYEASLTPDAAQSMPEKFNRWQQNIRAIYKHSNMIKKIFVLAPNNDVEQQQDFKKYIESALPNSGNIVQFITDRADKPFYKGHASNISSEYYEDYNYVFSGVMRALEIINDIAPEATKDEICVDATSGQKTFSIAAAIATLNASSVFSYVNNAGVTLFYNASVEIGQQP